MSTKIKGNDSVRLNGESADRDLSGIATAWANIQGSGTVAIQDSLGVSSIADNGTGDYTYTWANAMSNGDYSYSGSGGDSPLDLAVPSNQYTDHPPATGSIRIDVLYANALSWDPARTTLQVMGDLA